MQNAGGLLLFLRLRGGPVDYRPAIQEWLDEFLLPMLEVYSVPEFTMLGIGASAYAVSAALRLHEEGQCPVEWWNSDRRSDQQIPLKR